MESINNISAAVAKTVPGSQDQGPTTEAHSNPNAKCIDNEPPHGDLKSDSKLEPLSGVTGDTSKGEPYDAGNFEDPIAVSQEQSKLERNSPSSGNLVQEDRTGKAGSGTSQVKRDSEHATEATNGSSGGEMQSVEKMSMVSRLQPSQPSR